MDFAQYWFRPEDESGFSIPNSLRFRDTGPAYLTNTDLAGATLTDYTISVWAKQGFGVYNGSRYILTSGSAGTNTSYLSFTSDGTSGAFNFAEQDSGNVGGTWVSSPARNRDPSAWYHLVASNDSATNTQKLWVNGELQSSSNSTSSGVNLFSQSPVQIGLYADPSYVSTAWEGYLADFYFVEQVLEPTAFGAFNENGVWVPREVDFTPARMRPSDFLTVDGGATFVQPTTNTFDGSIATSCETSIGNVNCTFAPAENIDFNNTLRVYSLNAAYNNVTFNGTTIQPLTSGDWTDVVTSGGGTISATSPLVMGGFNGGSVNWAAIEVDGKILANPFIWSQYCTAEPSGWLASWEPAERVFKVGGGEGGYTQNIDYNDWIKFEPPGGIRFNDKIEVKWWNAANAEFKVNGQAFTSSVPLDSSGWDVVQSGGGTFNSFEYRDTVQGAFLYAVRVDGVLVKDGLNVEWGANGFHLDFSDPDDLGKDVSGNGNDFTATGFNTAPVGIWSNYLTSDSGWESVFLPTNAFDGSTGSPAIGVANGGQLEFAPATSISVSSGVWIYAPNPIGGNFVWNSTTTPHTVVGWNFLPGTGEISVSNPITFTAVATAQPNITAFAINDQANILTDNTGTDYDLMQDSPTQNYATGNPLQVNAYTGTALTDANLTWPNSAVSQRSTTIPISNGNWYFEYTIGSGTGSDIYPQLQLQGIGTSFQSKLGIGPQKYFENGVTADWTTRTAQLSSGETARVTYDSSTGTVTVTNPTGETWTHVWAAGAPGGVYADVDGTYTPAVGFALNTSEPGVSVNFGQKPFTYTPPEGFEALQTQNMPTPAIPNGRDHFQAITAQGSGTYCYWTATIANGPAATNGLGEHSYTVSNTPALISGYDVIFDLREETTSVTFDFSQQLNESYVYPGWMVINDIVNDTEWINKLAVNTDANGVITITNDTPFRYVKLRSLDNTATTLTVENLTPGGVSPILGQAQQTFPNGLWWIKDRVNDNQHQLVDSVRGGNLALQTPAAGAETAYTAPAGDSVAWCWKAGDAAVSNNDGSIASQVSVNTDAGFSIVSYTGNLTAGATVGHGLGATPDMIIVKGRDFADEWHVKHVGIGNNSDSLRLNSAAAVADFNAWNNTAPNSSVFTLGPIDGTNKGGAPFIAYCWTARPGYSAFGSYEGNGDSGGDGPYVYTGFSVAFLLIKRVTASANWCILDSTRDTSNPAGNTIFPNSTLAESALANQVDFTSNGFKLRGSGGVAFNAAGSTYVYAAFAENPFGGVNVSPANAR